MEVGMEKTASVDLDFLVEPSVQFENRVSPTSDAKERFEMKDPNHRHVTGQNVLDHFWSAAFQSDRPSLIKVLPLTDD